MSFITNRLLMVVVGILIVFVGALSPTIAMESMEAAVDKYRKGSK
jgi:uncharacterized membrane protein